jgi:hypothetical protein
VTTQVVCAVQVAYLIRTVEYWRESHGIGLV